MGLLTDIMHIFGDNGVAHNLTFSAICWWLFGLWAIMLMVLFSTIANSNTGVLAGTGAKTKY